jgi:hypothetical protein
MDNNKKTENEPKAIIGDKELLKSDMTPEQLILMSHVESLKNKISKLQFEIDELIPSLRSYEQSFINSTKEKAEEVLEGKSENTEGGK